MLTVVSANVNGVRAAARRGGVAWLAALDADVLCLQEVRADGRAAGRGAGRQPARVVRRRPHRGGHAGPGRCGDPQPGATDRDPVRRGPSRVRHRRAMGRGRPGHDGRSADRRSRSTPRPGRRDTPTGRSEKYRFLDAMSRRMGTLRRLAESGGGFAVVVRRPQRRARRGRPEELARQPREVRLAARGAGLPGPVAGPRRVGRRHASAVGARARGRTRGGPGGARRSTPTRGGGSTTSWPPEPWLRGRSGPRSAGPRPTPSVGATTRPSSPATTSTLA